MNAQRLGTVVRLELTQRTRSIAWYVLLGVFALLLLIVTVLSFLAYSWAQQEQGSAIYSTIVYITHHMEEVERLADRVMIIKAGRRQLLGRLADVKREHGHGLLEVVFEGALPELHATYEVVSSTPTSAKLKPKSGSTDQDVLLALTSVGLRIRRYEFPEPSLNDIFIKIYTRGEVGDE